MSMILHPSQGVVFPDGSRQITASEPKNLLINGSFAVDQWNSGAAVSTPANIDAFPCDRWVLRTIGSSISSQRIGTPGAYALQLTGLAGNTSVTLGQRIESHNIAHLVGKLVTFSFNVSSTSLSSVSFLFSTPTDFDSGYTYPSTAHQTFSILPSTQRISLQFTVPPEANKGLQVLLRLSAFSLGTFTISDAQLELGPTFTTLAKNPIDQILSSCQRYFWVVPKPTFDTMNKAYSPVAGAFNPTVAHKFPVTMRIPPTANSSDVTYISCSTLVAAGVTSEFASWTVTTASAVLYSTRFAATYNSEIY